MKTTIITLITGILALVLSSNAFANNSNCSAYSGSSPEAYIQVADDPTAFNASSITPETNTLTPQAQKYLCSINPAFSYKLSKLSWDSLITDIQEGFYTANIKKLVYYPNSVTAPQTALTVAGKGRKTRQAQAKVDARTEKNNTKKLKRVQKDLETVNDRAREDQGTDADRMQQLIDRGFNDLSIWLNQKQDYTNYYLDSNNAALLTNAGNQLTTQLNNALTDQTNAYNAALKTYTDETAGLAEKLDNLEEDCSNRKGWTITVKEAAVDISRQEAYEEREAAKRAYKKASKKNKKAAKERYDRAKAVFVLVDKKEAKQKKVSNCIKNDSKAISQQLTDAKGKQDGAENTADTNFTVVTNNAEAAYNVRIDTINANIQFSSISNTHMFDNMNNEMSKTQEDTNFYAGRFTTEQARLIDDSYENAKRFISDVYDLDED